MFVILVFVLQVVLTNALEPITNIELGDDKIKEIMSKYIANVPDIKEQYVIDERLSKAISHYFKGKVSSFPLYKVSVKIDRNPVKIPWTLGEPNASVVKKPRALKKKNKQVKKRYKYENVSKKDTEAATEKPVEKQDITSITPKTTHVSTINTTL